MIFQATQRIADALEEADLKHQIQETDRFSLVVVGVTGDNCSFHLHFISVDDDNDVKVVAEDFAKIPAARWDAACRLLNELNREYVFFKFTMDDEGTVRARYDFPLSVPEEKLGGIALEVALRCATILDDAYPRIMQLIWGAAE